ncbi:MAG: 2-dehydro-3-deoxyphosphogluconate aldolase, partial [Oscillospiraceae bacterium]|nr:2-dehydro-3-deoxyphosphogluconate aldolase [Oscillospiraceae bacterium]
MDVLAKMAESGIVPVVVLEKAEDAVPTAKAMLKGGVGVMEITFRTAAAADCIRAVASEV